MKKILCILLACVLLLGLCACGAGEGANTGSTEPAGTTAAATTTPATTLQVGFGAGDITPNWPIGLQGYGNQATRISTGFSSYIYIYCVAITDSNDETVLIMSLDSGNGKYESTIRPMIEQKFNIPQDHIIFSAIHQHSTPVGSAEYLALMSDGAEKAVRQALDDRAPATMHINKVETNALSFVRNYVANDPARTIVGDNYNDSIGAAYGYLGHESESDKEMRLIKFVREEGKKPIIMVNFQAHPHLGTSAKDTSIHSDWPGIMRDTVADKLDAHCIYLGAAGGNQICLACGDSCGCVHYGLHAAAADHIQRVSGNLNRYAGADGNLAGGALLQAGGQHVTHHHFVQPCRIDLSVLNHGLQDLGADPGGGGVLQAAQHTADGATLGTYQINFTHNAILQI